VRAIVLLKAGSPVIQRTVAEIATASNPAPTISGPSRPSAECDRRAAAFVCRVVRGSVATLTVNSSIPDVGGAVGNASPELKQINN
jgi:hypothetical protein